MEGAIVGPSSLNGFLSHGMLDYQLSGSYEAMFDYPLSEFYEAEAQGPLLETSVTNFSPFVDLSISNYHGPSLPTPSLTASPSAGRNNPDPKITYRKALRRGDALLCLPRHVRNIVYTYLLNDSPEFRYIKVPEVRDPVFPPFASFSDMWYTEACELMIQRATFSLANDCSIFNLMVFFNEFEPHESYEKATTLEFTKLSLFVKGEFSANSTKLLQRCPNIKKVSLLIDLSDMIWTYERGGREIDIDAMLAKYDLEALTRLGDIETVTLDVSPSMALSKRLMLMEEERLQAEQSGAVFAGVDSFWGLKEWLVVKALDHIRVLTVLCHSRN